MKKTGLFFILLLVLLVLCSCNTGEQSSMEIANGKTVNFINGVTDADIWILPQTEKNLKTTVWGTATAQKVKTDENRQVALCEPGDEGLYIIRLIDSDGFYYSADRITLEEDWTLQIKEVDTMAVKLEVRDKNGDIKNAYDVFSAKL